MSAVAIALAMCAAPIAPVGTADTGGGTPVPLTPQRRGCDGGILVNNFWGTMMAGFGEVFVRTSGNTVTAELQFLNTRFPGKHYDVGLIQAPRPASMPCGPGTPGTSYTGMDLDAAGRASVTLQSTLQPGTTGVWLQVTHPATHSQDPDEYYTTSYIAHV